MSGRRARVARRGAAALFAVLAAAGCGDDGGLTEPPAEDLPVLRITLSGLPVPAPLGGRYEAWVTDTADAVVRAGVVDAAGGDVRLPSPVSAPTALWITLEPAGDEHGVPSELTLVGGRFVGDSAVLGVEGYLTPIGQPLEAAPGTHVLHTFSNDDGSGASSDEDAGIWLMNPAVDTTDMAFYARFAPLTAGWLYEGWVVRDYGTADALWISYGKFAPGPRRYARFRDDTGPGGFSGYLDYEKALLREVHWPGDDFLANPLAVSLPEGLSLPLDLNGSPGSPSRWTHVITVEPYAEREEAPLASEPFFLRLYRNPIGDAPPEAPRTIVADFSGLPAGLVRLER
ncbi:MAG: hypothetical protein D6701_00670 [Gemmatimonadetes bacterium]|nr:MAG: hypothetical protein D6701_00670 [Gemmatimonadota bacterium]